jgi:enoyl-CoA hydratase/carnithine racemase
MTTEITYERRGAVGLITLERPQALNALTYGMIEGIEAFAKAAEKDPEVLAICITGLGRGFCAGIDMSLLEESTRSGPRVSAEAKSQPRARPALFSFLLDISKPVIAAVNGVSAGGGFVLAMMCDLRFVSHDAYFTTVFARRGLIAEHGTSWLLPRMIGLNRALDLLWSSRRVDADEAWRLGLADRIMPADQLISAVEAYVADMKATVAPKTLATMKAQVHRHLEVSFDVAAQESDALMTHALKHPDALEGAMSFIERRAPKFSAWTGDPA